MTKPDFDNAIKRHETALAQLRADKAAFEALDPVYQLTIELHETFNRSKDAWAAEIEKADNGTDIHHWTLSTHSWWLSKAKWLIPIMEKYQWSKDEAISMISWMHTVS